MYTFEGAPWINLTMQLLEVFLYISAFCFFIYLCDIATFTCRGCKFESTTEEALGTDSRVWDPFKFTEHEECTICLMEFTKDDYVTVLPCDVRHYFHAHCIQEWSRQHSNCPLCKKEFTV